MNRKWDLLEWGVEGEGPSPDDLQLPEDEIIICGDCEKPIELLGGCGCGGGSSLNQQSHPENEVDSNQMQQSHEMWLKEAFRILKPGGVIKAFSGSRTSHRLTAAMEKVGFVDLRVIAWSYGCLSEDTEILTSEGWVPYHRTKVGHPVVTFDPLSNQYSWGEVEDLHVYPYQGKMYRLKGANTDQLVSPEHRCLVGNNGQFEFRFAKDLAEQVSVPIVEDLRGLFEGIQGAAKKDSVLFGGMCEETSEAPQEEKPERPQRKRTDLSGLWRNLFQVRLLFKKHQKPDMFSEMLGTSANGETFTEPSSSTSFGTQRAMGGLCGLRERSVEAGCLDQKSQTPTHLLSQMQWGSTRKRMGGARAQRQSRVDRGGEEIVPRKDERPQQPCLERWGHLLQKTWQLCWGKVREVSKRFFANGSERRLCYGTSAVGCASLGQTSKEDRDCSSSEPQPCGQPIGEPNPPLVQQRSQTIRASRVTGTDLARISACSYQGVIWCVTVKTGAFVARRNGKVFVTGNSGFPKSLNISKKIDEVLIAKRNRFLLKALALIGITLEKIEWVPDANPDETTPIRIPLGKGRGLTLYRVKENIFIQHPFFKSRDKKILSADDTSFRNWAASESADEGGGWSRPWIEQARKDGFYEVEGDTPVTAKGFLYDGWGTALKPAYEPVVVGHKPEKQGKYSGIPSWELL